MKLGARSTLPEVAMAVGDALRRAGIRAVLTGGACAAYYSNGAYHSRDADFVIVGEVSTKALDEAMATIGFRRRTGRYVHARVRYFVEFPAGPLGIGEDFAIRPAWKIQRGVRMLALTATDSCRDRLCAFYFWHDRQALAAAVAIARLHRVRLSAIRQWSEQEGQLEAYEQFAAELAKVRRQQRRG